MHTKYDLVIIGAGCAGLSLGYQLAKLKGNVPKTLLIEPRLTYENDRTWCFWAEVDNPFANLPMHQWKEVLVVNDGLEIKLDCSNRPYQVLSAIDFYEHTINEIRSNSRTQLSLGIRVLKDPEYKNGSWLLVTNKGVVATDLVVDTRPRLTKIRGANEKQNNENQNNENQSNENQSNESESQKAISTDEITTLWQSFSGYEVECEGQVFDPLRASLMDFSKPNSEYVGFTYVLPFTKNTALIEFTTFGATPFSPYALCAHLEQAIQKYTRGHTYNLRRAESGLIPMGLKSLALGHPKINPGGNQTYVYAGVNAGAARAATGYAFQRIQNWASECALSIVRNGHPTLASKDSFIVKQMDSLFLKVLKNNPKLGPTLFASLFSNVDTNRLIRFLTDGGNFLDYTAVVRALPKGLFLKELYKSVASK